MRVGIVPVVSLAVFPLVLAASCGGSDAPAASIELTSAGLSRSSVSIGPGQSVEFRNADSVPHQMASEPHPTHEKCPELNGPQLAPGASFTATIGAVKTCGFHDHLNPTETKWHGSISVSASSGSGPGAGY